MRYIVAVSVLAFTLAPQTTDAQRVESFAQLPLRINEGDQVRVIGQQGTKVTGLVTSFGRDGLTIRTDAGERRFTGETVRRVDVRGQSKARGALIGAGTMLVVGILGCPDDSATGCPVFAALLWGAPLGTLIGAWVPSLHGVYRLQAASTSGGMPAASAHKASLLDDLGMRINLGDKLTVQSASGESPTGTLVELADDWLTLCDQRQCEPGSRPEGNAGGGRDSRLTRESIRRVSVTHGSTRNATLIGFLAGAALCANGEDWVDGIALCGAMGAGVGALIGVRIRHTTVVYPVTSPRVSLAPMVMPDHMGFRASIHF